MLGYTRRPTLCGIPHPAIHTLVTRPMLEALDNDLLLRCKPCTGDCSRNEEARHATLSQKRVSASFHSRTARNQSLENAASVDCGGPTIFCNSDCLWMMLGKAWRAPGLFPGREQPASRAGCWISVLGNTDMKGLNALRVETNTAGVRMDATMSSSTISAVCASCIPLGTTRSRWENATCPSRKVRCGVVSTFSIG